MAQLRMAGAQLAAIGRCALAGMPAGMPATQAVAEGAGIVSQQPLANAGTANAPNGTQTEQTRPATTAKRPLEPQGSAELNALPEAPKAKIGLGTAFFAPGAGSASTLLFTRRISR